MPTRRSNVGVCGRQPVVGLRLLDLQPGPEKSFDCRCRCPKQNSENQQRHDTDCERDAEQEIVLLKIRNRKERDRGCRQEVDERQWPDARKREQKNEEADCPFCCADTRVRSRPAYPFDQPQQWQGALCSSGEALGSNGALREKARQGWTLAAKHHLDCGKRNRDG